MSLNSKKKEQKSIDNTYGGIRYRFSYDDSRRAAAVRLIRQNSRGSRSFWLTLGTVTFFCLAALGISVAYRGVIEKGEENIEKSETLSEGAVAVNADICSEKGKEYKGSFSVIGLDDRAADIYHIPAGIMVAEVYEQKYEQNDDLILCGDIITSIDGVSTVDMDTFDSEFTSRVKRSVELNVFRKGKHISFSYVINDEK